MNASAPKFTLPGNFNLIGGGELNFDPYGKAPCAAHPGPHPTQASICFSMAIPGSVPLLRDAPALTGAPFALPFGSF